MPEPWRILVGAEETSALFQPAAPGPARATFVCAHGAGGHKSDRGMERLAATLLPRGFELVRFNFLYREKGSKRPDPMPLLRQCIEAVTARTRAERNPARLILGGRSMGGRAASMLAAGKDRGPALRRDRRGERTLARDAHCATSTLIQSTRPARSASA
jgi:hypothetical protein